AGLETADATAPTTDAQDVVFFTGTGAPDLGKRRDDWLNAVAGKLGVRKDRLEQATNDGAKDDGVTSPCASAAKALNITEEQLHKEQAAGKSLADIARAHNVDPKVVADALKAQ